MHHLALGGHDLISFTETLFFFILRLLTSCLTDFYLRTCLFGQVQPLCIFLWFGSEMQNAVKTPQAQMQMQSFVLQVDQQW